LTIKHQKGEAIEERFPLRSKYPREIRGDERDQHTDNDDSRDNDRRASRMISIDLRSIELPSFTDQTDLFFFRNDGDQTLIAKENDITWP
jgi:hypothetical protein